MKMLVALCLLSAAFAAADDVVLKYHGDEPDWHHEYGYVHGTWFHVQDFLPDATGFTVEWAELGLLFPTSMHSATMTVEIWNGDSDGPSEFLASKEIVIPETLFTFDSPVETAGDFWCLLNVGGGPVAAYIVYDSTPQGHSFFSDDFLVWEEFTEGEFFISVGGTDYSLETTTWGGIKGTY